MRIPCQTAGNRVAEADRMTGVLAPTLNALEQGSLDRVKARVIADHTRPLTPEQTQDLQDLVLPGVEELTTTELRDVTGQAVIIVDPDGAEDRHQEAAARRELRMQPGPDGMATLKAHLPADGAVKIFQVSDLLATGTAGTPGDRRGIGARRVDALVDIADHLLTHGFVDLTDYLGEQLPDHGTPTPRPRRTSTSTSTRTSTSTETAATAPTGSADVSSTEPAAAPAADTSDDNADTDISDKTTADTDTEVPADTTPATSTTATTRGDTTPRPNRRRDHVAPEATTDRRHR